MMLKLCGDATGDFYLDDCSHEEAVKALKASRDKVTLLISKTGTLQIYLHSFSLCLHYNSILEENTICFHLEK